MSLVATLTSGQVSQSQTQVKYSDASKKHAKRQTFFFTFLETFHGELGWGMFCWKHPKLEISMECSGNRKLTEIYGNYRRD